MRKPNLVLVRHGESVWNKQGIFTGWVDVDLSTKGEREAKKAGQLLRTYEFDCAYTSVLRRAIKTLWLILKVRNDMTLPIIGNWRLNERHYGALQGQSKKVVEEAYGTKQFLAWRRSFRTRPPVANTKNLVGQPKVYDQSPAAHPKTESLYDTYRRVIPYWKDEILPALKEGQRVLIVAHGNSLRALVKYLEKISDKAIPLLEIPTGQPWCYQISKTGKVKAKWVLKG